MRIRFNAPILGEIDLGRIRVPIGTFVSVVRGAIRQLGRFDDCRRRRRRGAGIGARHRRRAEAAEAEHRAASAIKDEADERIAEIAMARSIW